MLWVVLATVEQLLLGKALSLKIVLYFNLLLKESDFSCRIEDDISDFCYQANGFPTFYF